jgi:hypothetical protein
MINDDAKVSLLEWLFGKKVLDKAAKQGEQKPEKPPEQPQDNTYVKKQIEEQEKLKAKKAALDKLKMK